MIEGFCAKCGARFIAHGAGAKYCLKHRPRRKSRAHRARYGWVHQQRRKAWRLRVATGKVPCARCGELIDPDAPWDLDHRDDGRGYLGPSHAKCNRAAPSRVWIW